MEPAAIATVVAAIIAALAALVSGWYAQRAAGTVRQAAAEERAVRFREPLLQSAFNLQTRLFNMVRKNFLRQFNESERPGDRDYTIDNTLYLIGQYLCWVEIVRRESQFLDPRSQEREQAVTDQLERVRNAFAASNLPSPQLRIFRGQQRAIGEVLLEAAPMPHPSWPRWDCMGYACFVERLHEPTLERWFAPLRADLHAIRDDPACGRERILTIQHELLALVELLDPQARRTASRMRQRL